MIGGRGGGSRSGQWFMDKDRPITSDPANRDGCSKGIKGGCQTLADVMRESGCR